MTRELSLAFLMAAVIATAFAHSYYKLYFQTNRPLDLLRGLGLFAFVPFSNYLALRSLPIGIVYMSSAITQLIVIVLARWWFGEAIGRLHAAGMVLIVTGLVLYAW